LASNMFKTTRTINSESLSGRTIEGIRLETEIHYDAYQLTGSESARIANIGGMNKSGFDHNAWAFEGIRIFGPRQKEPRVFIPR